MSKNIYFCVLHGKSGREGGRVRMQDLPKFGEGCMRGGRAGLCDAGWGRWN